MTGLEPYILSAQNVTRCYGKKNVLGPCSLAVRSREVVAVVGPSGTGKSTLLRLLAGLESPDSGQIELLGAPVTEPSRRVSVVFQHYGLFPWRTALRNVEGMTQ